MKKIFTFLAMAAISASAMAATFTFSNEADLTQTIDGITVSVAKGSSNNAPAFYDNGLRLYASNTITVSGTDLTEIQISCAKQGSKDYATMTASAGTLTSGGVSTSTDNPVTDTWSGSASSVTFTLGTGQRLLLQVVVNGDGSETIPGGPGDEDPDDPDYPSILDPDFEYPEPTLVIAPANTVQGDAYRFVGNNIEVSCTKGAITADYFSAHAGYEMTFTAAKPIKGIAIKGLVKKGFEATVDHGDIEYLSPDEDEEANPCVVITDIDNTSVTISCVKQLRCYEVAVYFDENPDDAIGSGPTGGETETLTFDVAEAVYESALFEEWEVYNYSIYLCNAASYDYPYFALDIYPDDPDDITGVYTWDNYYLGDYTYYVWGLNDEDVAWIVDGEVTITNDDDIYSITGSILLDNGTTYEISFVGAVDFYTDDEYYGGGEGGGDDDGTGAVDEITVEADDAPAYDIQGRKVGKNYRGIVIRGGKKMIEK